MIRKALFGAAMATMLAASFALPTVSSAQQGYENNEHRLVGRVIEYKPWNLQLSEGPHIFLHPGTVIHPIGMTPRNGMWVRVFGHRTADNNFAADEIDRIPGPPPAFDRF